ncbi:MAG: ABC transporter ATP-binding protein [Propionibacteriaceae bacterium]
MNKILYQVDQVSRVYGSGTNAVTGCHDISLVVAAGERLGIVGESGSGKSTLIRMMAALDRPTQGSITFDGRDITNLKDRQLGFLRSRVQMVFQDPRSSLNPRMKVSDIVTEPLRSPLLRRRDDVPSAPAVRLQQVLEAVGLPADAKDRYPHEFSGGQRQRIAIARALAPKPEVLIADEPVSALDVSVRATVLNLLDDLVDEMGLTLVFVSHDLNVVRHVCNSVVVMRYGQIVERGTIEQVYDNPQQPYTQELLAAVPTIKI